MADIKQAAKWMQEGKRVRRSIWVQFIPPMYADDLGDIAFWGVMDSPKFEIGELLADDWEIAE